MSVINEALKRAARSAAGSQPNGPAVGPLLEPPAEPSPASPQETTGSTPEPGRRPMNVPRWALALGAILVLGLAYARLGTLPEGRSAAAEPAVWRQKIVDDRERLLAEVAELPEEGLAEEAAEAGPEAAGPEKTESPVAASGSPEGRDGAAAAVAAAPADDEDEEAEEEEGDAEEEEPPPEAASRPGAAPAEAPRAAPQPLAGQTPPPAPQRPPAPAPSIPAPGNNTGPVFAKNGVPPYGPLPADRFAYSASQPRPPAAASQQQVTDEIFQQATEREAQGKLEQAGALYALVLEKQPERESASLRLSSLLYGLQRFDEAAEVLRRAIKVGESAVLRNNLGTIYLAQGKLDLARDELSAAAAMDAAYADPHYNLACYYALNGQHQEGLAELMKAKDINPQVIEWAAQDGDLVALRAMPEYQGLTE